MKMVPMRLREFCNWNSLFILAQQLSFCDAKIGMLIFWKCWISTTAVILLKDVFGKAPSEITDPHAIISLTQE